MWKYAARRLLWAIPTIIAATIVLFVVLRILPGDIAVRILVGPTGDGAYTQEQLITLRQKLGVDQPLYVQYLRWIGGAIQGDFGKSLYNSRPVITELAQRLPITAQLALMGQFLALSIGIPLGVIAALKRDKPVDNGVRFLSILFLATPTFWIGLMILVGLSILWRWGPPLGYHPLASDPIKNLQQLGFPALILGLGGGAVIARFTRSAMLEVLQEDYMRTARSKGLNARAVILGHGLRNALIPVVTLSALSFIGLLSGTVVLETVFSLPGVGGYLFPAISNHDFPIIQTVFLFSIVLVIVVNVIVDLLYAMLDPRITYH